KIIGETRETVYDAWVHGSQLSKYKEDLSREVTQLIVYQRCNVEKLTPERLSALSMEREAIEDLKAALQEAVSKIPPGIRDKKTRQDYLDVTVERIFEKWQANKMNLSNMIKEIFNSEAIHSPNDLIATIVSETVTPSVAGG